MQLRAPGTVQAADDTPAAALPALFVTIMKHFNTAAAEKPPKIVELQTNLRKVENCIITVSRHDIGLPMLRTYPTDRFVSI